MQKGRIPQNIYLFISVSGLKCIYCNSLTAFYIYMGSIKDFFGNWFGYSRRERRSTFILLNIIVIILGLRYVIPAQNISLKEIPVDFRENSFDSTPAMVNTETVFQQKELKTYNRKRSLINLNSCDSASLVALPGIGPVLSSRIIKYRNLIGGYVSVNQLREVYGLKEETFVLVSDRLFADSLAIRKIKINEADYREIIRHPYFQKSEVSAILKYRELKGKITGIGEMTENNLISPETCKKIRPYLDFGE
jgi:DNA uptake protein ComE-like DNA-binding protein